MNEDGETVQVFGMAKKSYPQKSHTGSVYNRFEIQRCSSRKHRIEAAVGKRFESEYRRERSAVGLFSNPGEEGSLHP